jgi:hypothetical protein
MEDDVTKRKPTRAPKKPPKPRRPGLLGATRISLDDAATAAELAADEAMLRAKRLRAAHLRFIDDAAKRAAVNRLLAGSYTADGIRRWWQRRRPQLAGRTPEDAWATEPERVLELARELAAELGT